MRPIDGDKLLARYKERCAGCKETKNYCEHCCDIADIISDIEDAPTVDVVVGVRCLLCEHFDPTSPSGTVEPTFYLCKKRKMFVDPYDCCAFGERRKEDG